MKPVNYEKQVHELQDKLMQAIEQRQVFTIRKLHRKLEELKKNASKTQ